MNGFEKIFIIFAAAFTLEEYTASKEHGWTSKSIAVVSTMPSLTPILVYIANVVSFHYASMTSLTLIFH